MPVLRWHTNSASWPVPGSHQLDAHWEVKVRANSRRLRGSRQLKPWTKQGVSNQTEKAMAPHSSTLAWKIPWTEEPGGLQSMGSLRVGHDWATSLSRIGEGNGNPLQCFCLEDPSDGEAWWATIYGVAQSQTWLKRLSSSSSSKWPKGGLQGLAAAPCLTGVYLLPGALRLPFPRSRDKQGEGKQLFPGNISRANLITRNEWQKKDEPQRPAA